MQLVNTCLFNYRTNFNSFFKTEKLSKFLISVLLIISSLVIAIIVLLKIFSDEFKEKFFNYEFKFFFPYGIIWYIEKLLKKFWIFNFSINKFENIFFDNRIYSYGAFFLFTIEKIRLFIKYKIVTKKWNKFSLSYGVVENKNFLRVKKELLRNLGNVLAFASTLLIYLGIILFITLGNKLSNRFNFVDNLVLEGIIFSFFIWIVFVIFYFVNIKKRINNYYRNYYKKKDINKKLDFLVVIKSLFWHLLLNLFGFFMVVLNTPIDLFIIFISLKFIPWNNISKKLLLTNREKLSYSNSKKTLLNLF